MDPQTLWFSLGKIGLYLGVFRNVFTCVFVEDWGFFVFVFGA